MSHLTKKTPNYSTLQRSLIQSLDAMLKHAPKPNEIKRVSTALKGVYIPDDKYLLVLDTIFLILRARPDLWENPKFSELEEICRHCAAKIGSLKGHAITQPIKR